MFLLLSANGSWIMSGVFILISVDDQLQVERIKFRKGMQQLLRKKKNIIQKAALTSIQRERYMQSS